jgi:hypothetical protein
MMKYIDRVENFTNFSNIFCWVNVFISPCWCSLMFCVPLFALSGSVNHFIAAVTMTVSPLRRRAPLSVFRAPRQNLMVQVIGDTL